MRQPKGSAEPSNNANSDPAQSIGSWYCKSMPVSTAFMSTDQILGVTELMSCLADLLLIPVGCSGQTCLKIKKNIHLITFVNLHIISAKFDEILDKICGWGKFS